MPDNNFQGASEFADLSKRELPSNYEAERSVLSACMLKQDVADEICVMLEPNNFKSILNRNIFEAVFEIVKQGEAPEPIAVKDKMQASGKLSQMADETYIGDLLTNTNALVNWKKHAEIVKRISIQRDLIAAAAEITSAFIGYI